MKSIITVSLLLAVMTSAALAADTNTNAVVTVAVPRTPAEADTNVVANTPPPPVPVTVNPPVATIVTAPTVVAPAPVVAVAPAAVTVITTPAPSPPPAVIITRPAAKFCRPVTIREFPFLIEGDGKWDDTILYDDSLTIESVGVMAQDKLHDWFVVTVHHRDGRRFTFPISIQSEVGRGIEWVAVPREALQPRAKK